LVDPAAEDPQQRYDLAAGAAYVFTRTEAGWLATQRVVPSVPGGGNFGASIALWGDRLIIGAWQHTGVGAGFNDPQPPSVDNVSAGAAFSFMRGDSGLVEVARLGAAEPVAYGYAGWSVAVSEHASAIGAGGVNPAGVFVFPWSFCGAAVSLRGRG
jgi:hypothetical protein